MISRLHPANVKTARVRVTHDADRQRAGGGRDRCRVAGRHATSIANKIWELRGGEMHRIPKVTMVGMNTTLLAGQLLTRS